MSFFLLGLCAICGSAIDSDFADKPTIYAVVRRCRTPLFSKHPCSYLKKKWFAPLLVDIPTVDVSTGFPHKDHATTI